MKKSIVSLMAAVTLFVAVAPVFADDNYELKAEYVDENGNATEVIMKLKTLSGLVKSL
ncbi:hypothetical protein [Streptococcus pluranimalium]|uniref:hypothetical protein n=1 Tax=Streptococcus pluranimalium TaxID=82348 RepID=UPI001319E601|nr:hypothetical protein [Streptococcus pluranimalium]MDY3041571.1 hypothetical protein [Streptococcus pluranimalium]HEM6116605.1 hypothetical protein [Streptococcus suis]